MNRIWVSLMSGFAMAASVASASADTLRIGTSAEPVSLDPHMQELLPNKLVARHIFDNLILQDERQRLKPGLAVSWKTIDDKTWEFKLRPGVKWSDGSPFTADDVVFTFKRAGDGSKFIGEGMSFFIKGKDIKKIDDLTVQISTAGPYPLMPTDLSAFAIVSKKHGESATSADFNSGKALVGTGPYKFVEWVRGDRLVLEANPNYWGGKPKWDRVFFKPMTSDPSRLAALLGKDVDMIDYVPTNDVQMLKKRGDVVISEVASNRVIHMSPDTNRHISPFVKNNDGSLMFPNALRDQRVRRAISMAINRNGIVERVMDGNAIAAGQIMPPGFFGFNPDMKVERYDPAGAKKLLAEAGYPDGFRLTIHGSNDRFVNDAKIVEAIAQMLTQIGIKTEVVTLPTNVYFSRSSKLEFSFGMYGYGSGTGEPSAPLKGVLHTYNREAGWGNANRARYSNVVYDAKIEEALVTLDDTKREKLFFEATDIAINDYAFIPLHYQVNTWALRKGLDYQARSDEFTLAESVTKQN